MMTKSLCRARSPPNPPNRACPPNHAAAFQSAVHPKSQATPPHLPPRLLYLSGDAPSLSGGHGGGPVAAAAMVSSAGSLLAMLQEAAPACQPELQSTPSGTRSPPASPPCKSPAPFPLPPAARYTPVCTVRTARSVVRFPPVILCLLVVRGNGTKDLLEFCSLIF
jgi:hypothetical protein